MKSLIPRLQIVIKFGAAIQNPSFQNQLEQNIKYTPPKIEGPIDILIPKHQYRNFTTMIKRNKLEVQMINRENDFGDKQFY